MIKRTIGRKPLQKGDKKKLVGIYVKAATIKKHKADAIRARFQQVIDQLENS